MRIDNVADLIAETLAQAGVKRIFGIVGDSLNGLTEALVDLARPTFCRAERVTPPRHFFDWRK